MFALYASRKQGKLQRACTCGDSVIHVCTSGLFVPVVLHIELHGCRLCVFAPVVGFTCAHPAFLPPSSFTLNFTGADRGFLPPSSLIDIVPNSGKSPLCSGCFAIRRGLGRYRTCNAYSAGYQRFRRFQSCKNHNSDFG